MSDTPQNLWHPNVSNDQSTDQNLPQAASNPAPYQSYGAPQAQQVEQQAPETLLLEWEASEYVHHEKDGVWIASVIIVGLLLAVVSWLILNSLSFAVLSIVMAIAVVVMAVRPPQTLVYRLTDKTLQIAEKAYSYGEFKVFDVHREGSIYSLILIPVKRFRPSVSLYFPEEYGEQIVDIVGSKLPMTEIKPDFIDTLTRKIRF